MCGSLRRVASDVRGGAITGCGHFVPEARREHLASELAAFFQRG